VKEESYFTIGEFSKKTGTTIRTLHYYDQIGLLKPKKNPRSGHRLYSAHDVLTLQKIVSLKFLGYSLEQIKELINETNFDLNLKETLQFQKEALEERKEHIEEVLKAIKRILTILEEEKEVDSNVLMSLIQSIQTEKEQRKWLEHYTSKEVAEKLFDQPEEVMISLDKEYIQLSQETKRLAGRPVDDPEVEALVEKYMKTILEFIGKELISAIGNLDEAEIKTIENKLASPFTQEEEEWLQQVMEHYAMKAGLLQDENIDRL
jgi:DNA-binding transcriptional MerR regulator